jgi:hypothetical protein
MLRDCPNVYFCKLPNWRSWTFTRVVQKLSRVIGLEIIGLGSYGENFFPKGIRFDHNFYQQANIDFSCRWDSFSIPRNEQIENELFEKLECSDQPYIFLHEDVYRNYTIDRRHLPSNLRVIQPFSVSSGYSLFDYRKVMERATELHLIESSFAAFAESIDISVPKYAHRYARGHALHDFRHEFTYRSNWTVLR